VGGVAGNKRLIIEDLFSAFEYAGTVLEPFAQLGMIGYGQSAGGLFVRVPRPFYNALITVAPGLGELPAVIEGLEILIRAMRVATVLIVAELLAEALTCRNIGARPATKQGAYETKICIYYCGPGNEWEEYPRQIPLKEPCPKVFMWRGKLYPVL
jgi:hypothetical protein